jgi:hypothetical protein
MRSVAAGEMPAIALLAAVAAKMLAELRAVPECRSAGLGLGRKPALACADLAPPRRARPLVSEPALDVRLSHDDAYFVRTTWGQAAYSIRAGPLPDVDVALDGVLVDLGQFLAVEVKSL